jgi:hypothetical protein
MSPIGAANDLAAGCKVSLAGAPLDDTLADQIMEVRVETTVGLPDVCTLRLYEDADTSGTLKVIDDARFALGKPVASSATSSTARSRRSKPSSAHRSAATPSWS